MIHQQFFHAVELLIDRQIHQADDRTMRQSMDKNQLTPILVIRDKHAPLLESQVHQPFVARFWIDGESGQNVMSLITHKPGERMRGDADIQRKLHDARTLGTRSWIDPPAIDRRA